MGQLTTDGRAVARATLTRRARRQPTSPCHHRPPAVPPPLAASRGEGADEPGLPKTIALPEAARQVSQTEDSDVLEALFNAIARGCDRMRHPLVTPGSDGEDADSP